MISDSNRVTVPTETDQDVPAEIRAYISKLLSTGSERAIVSPYLDVTTTQSASTNTSNIVETLRRLHAEIQARDPLLQRGIPEHYVCVVNPALIPALKAEFYQAHPVIGLMQSPSLLALTWLNVLTGRTTIQIPDAPLDRIEYMSPVEMYRRYAAFFQRMARRIHKGRMLDRRYAADRQREGGQGI